MIDTDETTKNSDDEEEEDEADKTIDDNTEDDSAVWIELYIMKEKKENYAIEDLKSSFLTVLKKLFLAKNSCIMLRWQDSKHWFNGRKTTFQVNKKKKKIRTPQTF